MTKSQETQLALHEQRIGNLEAVMPRIESKIDSLIDKIDDAYVTRKEYTKDYTEQEKLNTKISEELEEIKETMVCKKDFKEYNKSQFWQKALTFFGGLGSAVLLWFIIEELKKYIGG